MLEVKRLPAIIKAVSVYTRNTTTHLLPQRIPILRIQEQEAPMVVSVRITHKDYAMLEAVRVARGDETRTDTLRVAIKYFIDSHLKEVS